MGEITANLKSFLGMTEEKTTSSVFNSNSMNLIASYPNDRVFLDDQKRLEYFYEELHKFIKSKAEGKGKTCTYDIPDNLLDYTDVILKHLVDLGFAVIDMGHDNKAFEGSIGISWKIYHSEISGTTQGE